MKTSVMLKLGSSALLLGIAAVGCTTGHPASLSSVAPPAGAKQAAKLASQAEAAIKVRQTDKAVAFAEQAVTLSPRDANYRATLGQAYLLAGRFSSAEASFAEAASLDPQPRTRFNLALTQVALGTWDVARTTLKGLDGAIPDADLGLATALAGDKEGGIAILERAARGKDASVKARQNLALAYALDDRWNDAQAVAAQDVPADQLPARLTKWAQFAKPQSSWDQVASLLGVTPVQDPGRPAALALADPAPAAPAAPVAAVAAAEQPAAPAAPVAEVAPNGIVQVAATEVAPAAPAPMIEQAPAAPAAMPVRVAAAPARAVAARPRAGGRWVVQLGSYAQPRAVETAWGRLTRRVWAFAGYAPARSTFTTSSATVHRLALSGFATRGDAQRMCARIRSRGGDCFVRASAGEQPIQWVNRTTPTRIAMR